MNCEEEVECFHQSIQGSGSLFIGKTPTEVSLSQLNKSAIRAIIVVSSSSKIPFSSRNQVLSIDSNEKDPLKLKNNFYLSFDFIERNRKRTNILVTSSEGRNISIAFLLGYLMKKYKYDLEHLSRLLKINLNNFQIPEEYEHQLKKISAEFQKVEEEQDNHHLISSRLGRRIIRIRRDYNKIAEGSRYRSLSRRASQQINPEHLPLNSGRKASENKITYLTSYSTAVKPLFRENKYQN